MFRRPAAACRSPRLLVAVLVALILALASSCDSEPGPNPGPSRPESGPLTFGVFGTPEEIAAYQAMVEDFNAGTEMLKVELKSWPTREAMLADIMSTESDQSSGEETSAAPESGTPKSGATKATTGVPDLFMVTRRDLAQVQTDEMNEPLIDLLDERGVDFGDNYFREALDAFSADNELQCMPYSVSPMVMYYNTDLVNFDRMRARDLPAPEEDDMGELETEWTFEEFTAAAEFASRPRTGGAKGVYVDPTLRGLSPFIYSGGGQLFDDEDDPTSLAFSTDETRGALTTTLELLRDPQVTLVEEQLAQKPALEWFKDGKLGMIQGTRALTPELRKLPNLKFDVMPMPVLNGEATVGDITGLCVSSSSKRIDLAADFLVHAISEEALAGVAQAGYVVPASLEVAVSDAFLQEGMQPVHAGVFNASVANMVVPPLLGNWDELSAVVQDNLMALITTPVPEVEELTTQIDEDSRSVLDPDYESPSDSTSPTG